MVDNNSCWMNKPASIIQEGEVIGDTSGKVNPNVLMTTGPNLTTF